MKKALFLKRSRSFWLIFICWLVYSCSYIGKLSYNANINPIGEAFGVSYADTGAVSTFFFFAYGIGQVINGFLCKRYNIKYTIFVCLLTSAAANMALPFITDFSIIKYVWLINGLSMSFLWTLIIRLLSLSLPKKEIPKAIVAMGTTVATGTFLVYGMSSLFVAVANYRITFYVSAAIMLLSALLWLFSFNRLTKSEGNGEAEAALSEEKEKEGGSGGVGLLIATLAFFAVANNFTKDGLTAWTPDVLSEIYTTPSWLSILLTLLLPALAIFGAAVALRIYKLTRNFIGTCTLLFTGATLLFIAIIALIKNAAALPLTVFIFGLVSCLMAGVNNVITSMVPLHLKDKVSSGKLAGILNGFCYLGSTLSSYTLGIVADNFGWISVFYLLFALCIIVIILGTAYVIKECRDSKTRKNL
ncbi:MAG: MFS transporter [Clostridia bacterium]|nr:MFS transporter [Clostridia bacterium]